MSERRFIGIWLMAAYFFAKAGVVSALATTVAHSPTDASGPLQTIRVLLPLVQRLNAGPTASVVVALVLAAFGAVVGVCILARQKWAAVYVVVYHGFALIWFLLATLGLRVIGLDTFPEMLSSPIFQFEVASSLLMVGYLLQPRVMRSFGFS